VRQVAVLLQSGSYSDSYTPIICPIFSILSFVVSCALKFTLNPIVFFFRLLLSLDGYFLADAALSSQRTKMLAPLRYFIYISRSSHRTDGRIADNSVPFNAQEHQGLRRWCEGEATKGDTPYMAGMLRWSICANEPYRSIPGHQNRPFSWVVINSLSCLAEEPISRKGFHRFLPLRVRIFVLKPFLHPHLISHPSCQRRADQTRIWNSGRYWQGHQEPRRSASPCLLNIPFVIPCPQNLHLILSD